MKSNFILTGGQSMKKILFIFCLLLTGCSQEQPQDIWYSSLYHFEEQENGWREGFVIEMPKDENGKFIGDIHDDRNQIYFDGYNLKYPEIENCFVPVYDEKDQLVDNAHPLLIHLLHDQTRKEEVQLISNYFQDKKFDKVIDLEDLQDLEVNQFDKEELVTLYNKTLLQQPKEFGKYSNKISQMKQKKDPDSDIVWQVGCFGIYGYVNDIQIEAIIGDTYLSDRNHLSYKETQIVDELNQLETYILDTQDLLLEECRLDFEMINVDLLKEILNEIYTAY